MGKEFNSYDVYEAVSNAIKAIDAKIKEIELTDLMSAKWSSNREWYHEASGSIRKLTEIKDMLKKQRPTHD